MEHWKFWFGISTATGMVLWVMAMIHVYYVTPAQMGRMYAPFTISPVPDMGSDEALIYLIHWVGGSLNSSSRR